MSGIFFHQDITDAELQHGISQEFQSLVVFAAQGKILMDKGAMC